MDQKVQVVGMSASIQFIDDIQDNDVLDIEVQL